MERGRLPDGRLPVDGTYVLEMVAMDRRCRALEEPTRTALSLTPTTDVLISFPAGATIYDNTLTVRGTVQDDNLMEALSWYQRSWIRWLRESEGNNWYIFLSRLRKGQITYLRAYDGATTWRKRRSWYIMNQSWITGHDPTNVDSQVIKGTVRNNFLEDSWVEVTANDRQYATIFTEEGFQTPLRYR